MTTTKQSITREFAEDLIWITAAGNASGRIGAVIGNPWMMTAALTAVRYADRIDLSGSVADGTRIMGIHGANGVRHVYVRPDARPFDPTDDPWAK